MPRIDVVAAAIWDGVGKILVGQRAQYDTFPGVWEFVGGKVEENESLEQALHREIEEELKIQIQIMEKLGTFDFTNDGRPLRLHVYMAQWTKGLPVAIEHEEILWVDRFEIADRNWSEPDQPFLENVKSKLFSLRQLS